METTSNKPAGPVRDELMDQLHKANDHFHQARENLEAQMKGVEYRHQERVNNAAEGIRAAEREVEEISERIGQELRSQTTGEKGRAHHDDQSEHIADLNPLR